MKAWALAAAAVTAMGAPAGAAVITLESVDDLGANYQFNYAGTLSSDEGAESGSKLIIFDFAGYVDGSIFTPSPDLLGTTELVSATPFITPGYSDDPSIPNLVFTYVGASFHASGGPYAEFDFENFGALSTYDGVGKDAFTTFLVKNNPPAATGDPLIHLGTVGVPARAPVPEPAAWAMMLFGFGMVGRSMRFRRGKMDVHLA